MSAKKNLTVATLVALLAVPAFGATNASHALHIPSVTAHAAEVTGDETTDDNSLQHLTGMGNTGTPATYYGHTFAFRGATPYIDGKPYTSTQALEYAQSLGANRLKSNANNENYGNSNNTSNNEATNSNSNGSAQYASKSSLPQTGESNGNSKAMAMGAVALGASASMMALSIAKKHRQESELSSVSSEPNIDNGDGKPNNDSKDNIQACYHMIMSDTFDNISKDLK